MKKVILGLSSFLVLASSNMINLDETLKQNAINSLKNAGDININGYYIKCGTGAYDWLYVDTNANVGYKYKNGGSFDGAHSIKGEINFDFSSKMIEFSSMTITSENSASEDLKTCVSTINNSSVDLNAYYVKYDTGANDWAYIDVKYGKVKGEPSGYIYKFEGADFGNLTDSNLIPTTTNGLTINFNGNIISEDNIADQNNTTIEENTASQDNTTVENPPAIPDLNETTTNTNGTDDSIGLPPQVPAV